MSAARLPHPAQRTNVEASLNLCVGPIAEIVCLKLSLKAIAGAGQMQPFSQRVLFRGALFVSDGSTRWPGQGHDLKVSEACVAAPTNEIRARIIRGIAELNQHVERHQ